MQPSLSTRIAVLILCICLLFNCAPVALAAEFAITKQPVSVTVAEGEKASTSVTATGSSLSYQWYFAKAGSSSFSKASITGRTYSVTMTEARDGRQVYCVVTDKSGNKLTSNTVTLNMQHPVKITSQPVNAYAYKGEKASVTVKATGDKLTYQWYIAKAGSSSFSKSSITKNTYSVNTSASNNGRQVYCVITDAYGNTVKTNTVTLNMATTLAITEQPENVIVKEGETAKTSVQATGDGLSYQWYFANPGSSKFYKASITSATYSVTMTQARCGRRIYCVVTDKYGSSVTSQTVTLGMETPLVIVSQPKDAYAYEGTKAKVTVIATGEDVTYQWYIAASGSETFSKSSITSSSYSTTISKANNGRKVYCIITDAYGNTITTDTVTLNMAAPFAITKQPQDAYAYENQTATVTAEATGDNLSYQWYFAKAGSSKFAKASITSANYSVSMTEARNGRQIYCVITDITGNTLTTDTVTLTLAEPLVLVNPLNDVYTYENTLARITPDVTGTALSYTWYVSDNGSDSFVKSSIKKATYTVSMSESKAGRKLYCIITDGCGTSITTNTIQLHLASPFAITTQPESIYANEGDQVTVSVVATGDNLSYQWWFAGKGSNTFSKASITSADYSVTLTEARDGRQLYCEITDITGKTLKTNTVTIGIIDSLDEKISYVVNNYTSASMSDYMKALRLYDWLCANVAYDYEYLNTGIAASEYGVAGKAAMLDGTAVCQGYAQAYEWLLETVGIPAHFVTGYGNGGSHAWVIAQIDGLWYQFDPTWDEQGNGSTHNYFALSDMAMRYDHVQDTQTHLLCNSYAANYEYRNHEYDDMLSFLRTEINVNLENGIYSSTVTPEYNPWSHFWYEPDHYTVACILNASGDWAIDGRIVVTPHTSAQNYSYQFYPEEEAVISIEVGGITEGQFADGYVGSEYYYLYTGYNDTPIIKTIPENASLTFSSSDTSVLTVSSTGKVKALKEGTATLTIAAQNHKLEIPICVDNSYFLFDESSYANYDLGENGQLQFTCWYRTFANLKGSWTVDDSSIAKVTSAGVVTPVKYGKTTITGKLGSITETASLIIRKPVTAILLSKKTYTASVGDELKITFRVEVADQKAYWTNYGIHYMVGNHNWDVAHLIEYTASSADYSSTGYYSYIFTIKCDAVGTGIFVIDPNDGSGVTETITINITK